MCMSDKFWLELLEALELRARSRAIARFADGNTRHRHRHELTAALDPAFRRRTTAEWLDAALGRAAGRARVRRRAGARSARSSQASGMIPNRAASRASRSARCSRARSRSTASAAVDAGSPLGADNEALLGAATTGERCWRTPMKLAGLRVVDLSVFLPGPYLTLALADHGAEVIKIEPPDGDPARRIGARRRPDDRVLPQLEPRQEERRART